MNQRPELYAQVQRRIACAVNAEIPIDAVCSVDEICCVLGARDGAADVGCLWAALEADGAGWEALYRVQVWFDRLAAVRARQGELFARGGRGPRR